MHLHWVSHFIDYPSFFASIPNDFPVVWTLHDMNPFTGGCHFSNGCEAFTTECRNCPQLGHSAARDLSNRGFNAKRNLFEGRNLHVVGPSRWMTGEVLRSRILSHARSIRTIPYGLDTSVFCPQDKAASRKRFGLPLDRPVIAFGAERLANRRKGMPELLLAFSAIRAARPWIGLFFGQGDLTRHTLAAVEFHGVGYLRDPKQQAAFYSAADIFVLPSLQDNLPQTGLEAMACGTSVIGFDIGGIPDFVRPGQTGLLAKSGDTDDLARQIEWLINRPNEISRMGKNASKLIQQEFCRDREAAAYTDLYREILQCRCTARQRVASSNSIPAFCEEMV